MIDRRTLIGSAAALAALPRAAAAKRLNAIGLQLYTGARAVPEGSHRRSRRWRGSGIARSSSVAAGMTRWTLRCCAGRWTGCGCARPRSTSATTRCSAISRARSSARRPSARTRSAPPQDMTVIIARSRVTAALPEIARLGADLRKAGLGFAYHTDDLHQHLEFAAKPEGVSLFSGRRRRPIRGDVRIELDLYWARFAGQDVPAPDRPARCAADAFHVKDMRANRDMAAVGQGTIDFAALFRLNGAAGVRHFYVENDRAPAPYLPTSPPASPR
ncbi:sugar phosphate isomerase/epimerase family protein [Sphingomonas sp. MMS24-JH45]